MVTEMHPTVLEAQSPEEGAAGLDIGALAHEPISFTPPRNWTPPIVVLQESQRGEQQT